MAIHGVEALAEDSSLELVWAINPANQRLGAMLAESGACQILEAPCRTRRPQGIRNLVDSKGIRTLKKWFSTHKPDLVLCVQGDIEQSSQAVIAANDAGIDCISYIALPHSKASMGARLGELHDHLNRHLFDQPARYITVSKTMAERLRERGATRPITVVPNGIAIPSNNQNRKPKTANFTLGLLGRIEFKQKQQDLMVKAFCDFPQAFENCNLLIAGEGPDYNRLKQLAASCARSADITIQPWQKDVDALFCNIDLLVIPSRYEGMPIVMLEALARGIPVVGSNRDGMRELLPPDWIFEAGNAAALAETFSRVRHSWQNNIKTLKQRVLAEYSLESFKTNFRNAVLKTSS